MAKKIGIIPIGLHAHRRYLERRGVPNNMEALADHDLIGFDTETPPIRAIAQRYPAISRSAFALRVDSDVAQPCGDPGGQPSDRV